LFRFIIGPSYLRQEKETTFARDDEWFSSTRRSKKTIYLLEAAFEEWIGSRWWRFTFSAAIFRVAIFV